MRAFEIENSREFMNALFLKDRFDEFLLVEADISVATDIHINGCINRSFFNEDSCPETEYVRFGDEREIIRTLIKGDKKPLALKIILFHPAAGNSDIKGGCINIIFSAGKVRVTSAVSMKTFTVDRSAERSWDDYVEKLINSL